MEIGHNNEHCNSLGPCLWQNNEGERKQKNLNYNFH